GLAAALRDRARPRGPGPGGLGAGAAGSGRRDVPVLRARRVHLPARLGLGGPRRRAGDAAGPARVPARGDHRAERAGAAGRGGRPGDRDGQGPPPHGPWAEGPEGHRVVAPPGPAAAGAARRTDAAVPRLVIAAPSSGAGKTTVATGLMAALHARGLRVSPHKVGPDYIDPGYHAVATGRPGRNLDPFLVGEDLVGPLFRHGARGCDVAVVAGVMGLFDGHAGRDFASTAHVARLLDAPVVLVVDASRAGRPVAALVHGFATFDPRVRLGGVMLPRIGSDRHQEPRRDALAVDAGRRMGELVARCCDLGAIVRLAGAAPPLGAAAWDPAEALARAAGGRGEPYRRSGTVVAVAGGPAFTFGYAEHVELLRAAGAEVAAFDPLRDEALPEGTAAVVLGGGFPEVYADRLAANERLRAALAAFGGPIAAECAGLLYLCRELDGRRMCGRIPAAARMTDRLTLGYREAVARRDSLLTRAGERLRGHEFHRTV